MDLSKMHGKSPLDDIVDEPLGRLDFGDRPPSNKTEFTAPPEWFGTPMEMVADAFGMKSPWRSREYERRELARRKKARSRRKDKAAKAARRRNRR
jgi:hypothetical protein